MTLITSKYDYPKLTRAEVNGKRKYQTPDGSKVSSVTTILDATKPEESRQALENWRKRVGHDAAKAITTEAANRGTRMHKYLEDYIDSGEWPEPGSNPFAKQSHRMATIVRDEALSEVDEIWGSEVALYVPQIYAGTTDLVGTYRGNPAIMDFKQSNKIKKEEWIQDYYLQMVAYALAHNEIHGTDIREGHIFMCTQDMIYQQFDLKPEDFDMWADRWWKRVEEFYMNHA
jgi:ATP-dependent exoDNAse (exonuclease V) beta subunit